LAVTVVADTAVIDAYDDCWKRKKSQSVVVTSGQRPHQIDNDFFGTTEISQQQ
jgi:hypothetical protein